MDIPVVSDARMRRLSYFLFLLLLVLPVQAKPRKKSTKSVERVQLAPAEARRLSYFYQEGIKMKLAGKLSEANDLFQHCLSINPTDPDALFEAGYLKFYLGQDSLGTEMIRQVVELDNTNPYYIQTLAAAYLSLNEFDKAIPVIERLSQLQPRRSDVLYQLVELYKTNGKTDKAIEAIERIELLEGRSLQTSMQKYALYLDKGKKEEAFNVLKRFEEESPYDLRIPIIRGRQYLENGEAERALECFETVRKNDPQNTELKLAMMEYYAQTQQLERRTQLRDSLLYAKDTPEELRAKMMTLFIEDQKGTPDSRERIIQTLDTLVRLSPSGMMHTLRVSYLMYAQASQDSIAQAMRDLLVVEPANEDALSRLLVYYLGRQDMDQVVEICHMGINAHPETLSYYFYLGVALSQKKQNAEAIEVLQNGLKQATDQVNREQISDFYEILGELYYEDKRIEDAFAAYDSCLVYKDDNATCLNNYAYYLSLRNERLSDAERMAYRAIKIEPLNKTFLDTYAWVLFMQENYTMARFYIDRVISPSQPDSALLADTSLHADVLEHAGDIYALNGNEELSLRYWSLALQKGEGSAILERKIKQKKYIKE